MLLFQKLGRIRRHNPEKVKNLVTLVTPVDFDTDKGLLHIWAKNLDVDKMVDYYGIVPGDLLNAGFLLTDPFRLMIDKYVELFERIECEPDDEESQRRNEETVRNFLRMEKWIFDSLDQAGEAFRQFIKDCYQKNLLIKNQMKLDGKNINLKNINMPLVKAKVGHEKNRKVILEQSAEEDLYTKEKVRDEIIEQGGRAIGVEGDVTSEEDMRGAVNKTVEEFGKINILINNAGIIQDALVSNMTREQCNGVINVDLTGAFYCIK